MISHVSFRCQEPGPVRDAGVGPDSGIAPFNAQLYFNTALIGGQLKDYRRAIKSMTIYLQLDPDAANARAAKDEIYMWESALEKGKK
jgi:hypothetical protein